METWQLPIQQFLAPLEVQLLARAHIPVRKSHEDFSVALAPQVKAVIW